MVYEAWTKDRGLSTGQTQTVTEYWTCKICKDTKAHDNNVVVGGVTIKW